jgi:DNA modification methylase
MAQEFVSELEKIMPAIELNFPSSPAFGPYRKIMPPESVQHPAKFNVYLVEFLIKNFTGEGEIVLDCMAGTGILGVIAALHGRNAIQVELERRFYEWMEKARENVEKLPTLSRKGWIVNICGDARKLSELLSQVQPSTIITSPPYLTDNVKRDSEEFWRRVHELGRRWGSKPPAGTEEKQMKSEGNIANLPLGKIDVVLTSPPYSDAISRQGGPVDVKDVGISTVTAREYSSSPENIGNLPHGNIDAIITSPPFTDSAAENQNVVELQKRGWIKSGDMTKFLPSNLSKENIGNLPFGDVEKLIRGLMTRDGKPTYLSEIFKVYLECFKVLKPNGLMIVVVKPFQRNFKVVDLPYHTYILLSRCGFILEKLYKLRLKQQSFWRILIYKKHPELPRIMHEYILVCRKPSS